MASSSSSSPSTQDFSSQLWKYHVFLSFRGEDTRKTFVDHLYTALVQQGIYTYKDDEILLRGESIGPSLMTAIEESQIAVIVFSKNYADSSWCLDELAHIMKCRDTRGQIAMPIFYDVDPSDVGKQKRKYGEAFLKHELENNKKVESWRKALVDASNISGWEPKHIANGHESKGIKEIVDTISHRLRAINSSVDDKLVGVEARMQDLISKLQIGFGGKRMVGIWGVGGGGKTTLASSIYDEISGKFDGCCFIKNVREESNKNGLQNLQEKILNGVLKQKQVEVGRVEEGRRMIKDRLHHRKVLIVLDDVDNLEYLEELAGSRDWLGEGSRIIITTRDEHVLTGHKVDVIHNITLLNKDEAMKLFCKHAPRENRPMEDYKLLSNEVVSYAGGLPLALRVLGRFLCDKEMNEWRSTLDRLKEIPEANILEKLKISFDGLKPVERELFLDIACFYRGHHYKDEHIMITLEACGFHPVIGIKVLVQKALVTISLDGRFDMHDLIEEMAHYIVRGEHPKNPAKHSRVWKEKDVRTICAMDATENLDKIEAIRVRCITCDRPRVLQVAVNMKKLRSIDLEMTGSDEPALPLMPDNFSPKELCCLTLSGLHAKQLWEGYKFLPNLRMIKLHNLLQTPHFDGLPNLERFMVYDSWKLKEIHSSFGHLEKLVSVWLRDCFELTLLPIMRSKKLETLRLSGCSKLFNSSKIQQNMENSLPHIMNQHIGPWFFSGCLRELDLSFCNLGDGDITSDAVWVLPNLKELNLEKNRFVRLSFSLLRLPRLKLLNVSYSEGLVELSELPSGIAVVKWDYCPSLESFRDISNFKWLWKGSAKNYFISINASVNMWSIRRGQSEPWVDNIWTGQSEPWVDRVKPYNMQLPHDWYNYFSGILMFIQARKSYSPHITIKLGFDLNFQPDLGLEDNGAVPESQDDDTFVGYVPFNSLRHTACLNSTYNFISFSIPYKERGGYGCLFRVVLVPKDDRMQTKEVATHSSQFWDEEDVYDRKTFTMQHDSNSSVNILWRPREL